MNDVALQRICNCAFCRGDIDTPDWDCCLPQLRKCATEAASEVRGRLLGVMRNRETFFRKWQMYMGGWDEGKEAWQVAAHCCGYLHGICSVEDWSGALDPERNENEES